MKKYLWGLITILIIFIILAVSGVFQGSQIEDQTLSVGAILPLSGPAAIWGQQFQRGMNAALSDLGDSKIEVVYEDSEANAAKGLSAFNKLHTIDKVDIIMSGFSRVSIPLKKVAQENKVPLIMSLVASNNAVEEENPYVFRIFHTAEQVGKAHFNFYQKEGYEKLGLLYVNDEYGTSVAQTIKEEARGRNIKIVSDSYMPGDTDFRTQLTKIKNENLDALVFVGVPPIELAAVIKQSKELGLVVPIIDPSGILTNQGGREALGSDAEGVYTIATPFDLRERGQDFIDQYRQQYHQEAGHAVSYGYDFIMLLAELKSNEIINELHRMKKFEGITSSYTFDGKGNILPVLYPAQVINGELKRI